MDDIARLESIVQIGWTLFASALVLFMQAGFCCLEAGSVRQKNSINVALKNIVDLCGSIAAYFAVGYGLMFGLSHGGLFGTPQWMLTGVPDAELVAFFFQATFCGTAATIVSGAIAERCRFLPYLIVSIVLGLLIYPVYGHWVWGGGWLSGLGFKDFAGSSVVHMVGAGVALAGIQVLGPRKGRFGPDGKARALPASSMPMVAVGTIILVFGWIGFNGGSAALSENSGLIIGATVLAACFGGLAALLATWAYGGLARVELVLNGVLGGLVAITACADVVTMTASAVIGVCGGIAVVIGTWLLEKMRLDDAVGAVPVHGVAGIIGLLATAVFATPEALADLNGAREAGGHAAMDRLGFVGVQALGAAVCLGWSYVLGLCLWLVVGRVTQLRIGSHEEQVGMNYSEHQVANPISDIAVAATLAASGRTDEVYGRLDNAGSGDTAQLAEAVRSLIQASEVQVRVARQFAAGLDELGRDLDSRRTKGTSSANHCMAQVEDLERTLTRMREFITGTTPDAQTMPILDELARSLSDRLGQLAKELPENLTAWRELTRIGKQLSQVVGGLRSPAGGSGEAVA